MGPPLEKVPDQIANFKEWVYFFFSTFIIVNTYLSFVIKAALLSAHPFIDLVANPAQNGQKLGIIPVLNISYSYH